MLSVVCPIYNEEKYISHFLDSLLEQDYPIDDLEILLVDGMSTDRTREIVGEFIQNHPFVRLLDNPNKYVPFAMNIGIRSAKGDVIIRLDAHAIYPSDYFRVLSQKLFELDADNVGTVCRTDVLNKNPKSLAIREVLSNKYGVGNSSFRTGVAETRQVDTVPFGCWKREVFDKVGYYNENLIRAQDYELNKRIIRNGGKIFIIPDTYCVYMARETFKDLAKIHYKTGLWDILLPYYTKKLSSISIRHIIPFIFLLSILLPILAGVFFPPAFWLSLFILLLYYLIVGTISFNISRKKGLSFFMLVKAFTVLHFSHAWGSFVGVLKLPFMQQ